MKQKGQLKIARKGERCWGGTTQRPMSLMEILQKQVKMKDGCFVWKGKRYANNEDGRNLLSSAIAETLEFAGVRK